MNTIDPDKERLWKEIEIRIKTDGLYHEHNREWLNRALYDLPEIRPERDLWITVEHELKPASTRIMSIYRYTARIAAGLALLAVFFLAYQFILKSESAGDRVAGREETVEAFLTRICQEVPSKCNEPDFIELRTEILELSKTRTEVSHSIFANPEDPDILSVSERIDRQIGNLKNQILDYVE